MKRQKANAKCLLEKYADMVTAKGCGMPYSKGKELRGTFTLWKRKGPGRKEKERETDDGERDGYAIRKVNTFGRCGKGAKKQRRNVARDGLQTWSPRKVTEF